MNATIVRTALLAALLCAACAKTLTEEIPEAPDMSGLLSAYTDPSADLSADTISELTTVIEDALAFLDESGNLSIVFDGLEAAGEQSGTEQELVVDGEYARRQQAITIGDVSVEGEGFMRIHRICAGWGENPAISEEANGYMELTATFTDTGLDPIIWGSFHNCRIQGEESQMEIRSSINLHVGDSFQIERPEQATVLFQITGELLMDDTVLSFPADFRMLEGGGIELRFDLPSGSLIFTSSESGFGFRAANGRWSCNFEERRCEQEGYEPISW